MYGASAPSRELQALAEELAKDELGHASLLRRERRKAWRAEGGSAHAPAGEPPGSVPALLAQSAATERAAAAAHRMLAARRRAADPQGQAAGLFEHAAVAEEELARSLEDLLGGHAALVTRPLHAASVRDGLRLLEHAFEKYTGIAERSTDEATMLEARALAETALRRLATVHGSIGDATVAA